MSLVSPCSEPSCRFPVNGGRMTLCANHKEIDEAARAVTKPRHKFNAKPTVVCGRKYPSKLEASYAAELHRRKEAGEVIGWIEQAPLRLAGGVTYLLDFLIFEADGTVRAVEVKGYETPVWKIKEKLVAEAYPWLPLEIVTKPPKQAPRAQRRARP